MALHTRETTFALDPGATCAGYPEQRAGDGNNTTQLKFTASCLACSAISMPHCHPKVFGLVASSSASPVISRMAPIMVSRTVARPCSERVARNVPRNFLNTAQPWRDPTTGYAAHRQQTTETSPHEAYAKQLLEQMLTSKIQKQYKCRKRTEWVVICTATAGPMSPS